MARLGVKLPPSVDGGMVYNELLMQFQSDVLLVIQFRAICSMLIGKKLSQEPLIGLNRNL
jgi:hypothetical protein